MRLAAAIANTIPATWITAMTSTATAMMPSRIFVVTLRAPWPDGTDAPHQRPSRAPRGHADRCTRACPRRWPGRTGAPPLHPQPLRQRTRGARPRRRDCRLWPSEDARLEDADFEVQVLFRIGANILHETVQLIDRAIHVLIQLL